MNVIYFEEWLPVNDDRIKPIYEVSNFGSVRNIETGKELKARPISSNRTNSKPYYAYALISKSKNPKYIHKTKHRIVMETFDPIDNMDQMTVNHEDGNKENCQKSNLNWTSQKENNKHARDTGLVTGIFGSNHCMSKLNEEQVHLICQYLIDGLSYKEILYKIGLDDTWNNRDLIGNIKRKISWKHISCNYF